MRTRSALSCSRLLGGLLASALYAFAAPPQQQPAPFHIGPVYTKDFPVTQIVMDTRLSEGQSSATITTDDLSLIEDGTVTVKSRGLQKFGDLKDTGVAVTLLIDVSGTMRGRPIEAVRKGLIKCVSQAREADRVAIGTIADETRWEVNWNASREDVKRAISTLQTRGRLTRLYNGIDEALTRFSSGKGADGQEFPLRRRIIAVSDGKDEGSQKTRQQVIARAREMHIEIDTIGSTAIDRSYLLNMQALANETNGSFRDAPTPEILENAVSAGIQRLLESPVAEFKVKNLHGDGEEHDIGVKWIGRGVQDKIKVRLPEKGLWSQFGGNWIFWCSATAVGALLVLSVLLVRGRGKTQPAVMQNAPPITAVQPVRMPTAVERSRTAAEFAAVPNLPPRQNEPTRKPTAVESPVAPAVTSKQRAKTQMAAGFPTPGPDSPAAFVRVISGPEAGVREGIETTEFWIGAGENNHLQLSDSTVSQNHACIRFEQQFLRIYDNHSTNKTKVNGQDVGTTARLLSPGDQIQIGQTELVLESNG